MRILMSALIFTSLVSVAACGDDGGGGNENEVITTLTLTVTPTGGGTAVTAGFDDPDGDGGVAPILTPLTLAPGSYTATVRFLNKLADPPVEITNEVRDEGVEHLVFFTGTAVNGPASDHAGAPITHAYADMDANGLPIGLSNTFVAVAGTGALTFTLRHMPPLNGTAVKTAGSAGEVKAGGIDSIGGSTDATTTITATVQ